MRTIRDHRCWRLAVMLSTFLWIASAGADPAQDTVRGLQAMDRDDIVDAMAWFRRAAEQGYSPAQVQLAYVLDKSEENAAAVKWYRRAAEQGDPAGQYGLGQMYLNGEGVKQDLEQGVKWITQAAENGLGAAMHTLVVNYETGGIGLPQDLAQARSWLERAAQQGESWAQQRLAESNTQ